MRYSCYSCFQGIPTLQKYAYIIFKYNIEFTFNIFGCSVFNCNNCNNCNANHGKESFHPFMI
jgi:hypothetical protein